jgi:archaemetzincin
MGLGFCPGNVCVASTFRLSKKNLKEQFYKVAIHELGHTQGLPHCEDKSCFMRDAEGGNPLNEEHGFCEVCKLFLKSKGWELN